MDHSQGSGTRDRVSGFGFRVSSLVFCFQCLVFRFSVFFVFRFASVSCFDFRIYRRREFLEGRGVEKELLLAVAALDERVRNPLLHFRDNALLAASALGVGDDTHPLRLLLL